MQLVSRRKKGAVDVTGHVKDTLTPLKSVQDCVEKYSNGQFQT